MQEEILIFKYFFCKNNPTCVFLGLNNNCICVFLGLNCKNNHFLRLKTIIYLCKKKENGTTYSNDKAKRNSCGI